MAILALAVLMQRQIIIWFYWSNIFLALGTLLFSGSLYGLALSNLQFWVYITPIGGACFLAGWFLMLIGALRRKRETGRHE